LRIGKILSIYVVWGLLVTGLTFAPGLSRAETKENVRWSIHFDNVSISDALDQLSEATGIKIVIKPSLENQIITRSYVDRTVDQIIKDLLRNVNHALVWEYGEKDVDCIRISILDRQSGKSSQDLSGPERAETRARPFPQRPGYPQPLPRKQSKIPEKLIRGGAGRWRGFSPPGVPADKEENGDGAQSEKEEAGLTDSPSQQNEKSGRDETEPKTESEKDGSGQEEGSPPREQTGEEKSGPPSSREEKPAAE
jgi:hypothetical protein